MQHWLVKSEPFKYSWDKFNKEGRTFQDPTTDNTNWVVVDLEPVESLKRPVTLEEIKADERLKDIGLVRQGRLSVMAVKREEFDRILELASN
jgi:predicted RNA-binding protein with PUA-like domain